MKKRILKRMLSSCLVASLVLGNLVNAYAGEESSSMVTVQQERYGVNYLIQCENYDIQSGRSTVDGEIITGAEIGDYKDAIIASLSEDTVMNTNDYLGNNIISNETDVYSVNRYNLNAGEVNLSNVIVSQNDINISASKVNGNGAILYSKDGNITISCGSCEFVGFIYAPNGTVIFNASNVNIEGVIVAKNVAVRTGNFNVSYNESVSRTVENLAYTKIERIAEIHLVEDEETNITGLTWENETDVSCVGIYARNGKSYDLIATTESSSYEITENGDYRTLIHTKFGEEIWSNIISVEKNEEGILEVVSKDTDNDGIPDAYEYLLGTDPENTDTDGDGFTDGYEAYTLCTDALQYDIDSDTDEDGVSDLKEYELGTNPLLKDSDFDGICDDVDSEPTKANVPYKADIDYNVSVRKGIFDIENRYIDESGNKSVMIYNYVNGQLKYLSSGENESYNIYNSNGNIVAAIEKADGIYYANTYTYKDDSITSITHNGFQYEFTYDEGNNLSDVRIGDRSLISYKYTEEMLSTEKYGNGANYEYVYDENGNLTSQKYNDKTIFHWEYDENSVIKAYYDDIRGIVYNYTYDENGDVSKIDISNGASISYNAAESQIMVRYSVYGEDKTRTVTENTIANEDETEDIEYVVNLISGSKLVSVDSSNGDVTRTLYSNEKEVLSTKYVMSDTGVSQIEYSDGDIIKYTYDNAGNIKTVHENGEVKLTYTYDSLGQLLREDNKYTGKTYRYTYDNSGNILSRTECDYNTENVIDKKIYEYNDNEWKDLLTGVNGEKITYDEIGNPLTYLGNRAFTWQGKQLKSIKTDDSRISYTYNCNGIRTSKTVDGITTEYLLEDTKIVAETTQNNTIWYNYDESDAVIGFEYKDSAYYYKKNAQGDIVSILDEEGNEAAGYIYDAWGNVEAVTGNTELANANPFRYRGYYQDNETGFYYLQSRYYDSSVGRFISEDDALMIGMFANSPIGVNLYAYCENNPVNMIDANGYFGTPIQWVCAVIGGVAGWYFGDYIARKIGLYPGKWWEWQTYAYWAVRGLVTAGGSILGWISGASLCKVLKNFLNKHSEVFCKLSNTSQKIISWLLGLTNSKSSEYMNQLYVKYQSHIFQKQHIQEGIMKLGSSQRQIFDKLINVMQAKMWQAVEGSNTIHAKINGYKVTIRFYIKNGDIKSLDAFMGWAERIIGKLLK